MSLSADLAWSHSLDLPEWLSRLGNCSLLMRLLFQKNFGKANAWEGSGIFFPGSRSGSDALPVSHAGPWTPMQPHQLTNVLSARKGGSSLCTSGGVQIKERNITGDSKCPSLNRGDTPAGYPDTSFFSLSSVFSPVLAWWLRGPFASSSSCFNVVFHCLENISCSDTTRSIRAVEFPQSYRPASAPLLAVISGAPAAPLQGMKLPNGLSKGTSKSELGRYARSMHANETLFNFYIPNASCYLS